eukprot:SAG11_NODE_17304_length_522_cov_0.789598_1_plen_100_part_10
MERYKQREKQDEDRANNTIWVTGIPADQKEVDFREWLQQQFGSTWSDARLVWDVNLLGHNIRARRKAIMKINSLYKNMKEHGPDERALSKIAKYKARVRK